MQGEGVEGMEDKFIFCYVSNCNVYVAPYVCQLFRKKYTFLFLYTFQCQLSVVSLLRRLTDN